MTERPECKEAAGVKTPVIDHSLCEGSGACVQICPYHVFVLHRLGAREFLRLPLVTKLKVVAHGGRQAFADQAGDCRACELCVTACPTAAIAIESAPSTGE